MFHTIHTMSISQRDLEESASHPSPSTRGSSPSMVEWESGAALGSKLFVASEVLFRDVLRIYLSDFGKGQEEPSLGIKV